jgi:hypothetical protein
MRRNLSENILIYDDNFWQGFNFFFGYLVEMSDEKKGSGIEY